MNPLASGAFGFVLAAIKCAESVWVVSPFMGIDGRDGLRCCPGGCAITVTRDDCNPNKTTRAIARNNNVGFLFIADLFCIDLTGISPFSVSNFFSTCLIQLTLQELNAGVQLFYK
jgi:hypothetical protein